MRPKRNTSATTFPELFERFAAAILPPDLEDGAYLRFQALARHAGARAGECPIDDSDMDWIVFIAEGATKLVAHASHGREQVVAFHFRGDLVSIPGRAAHAYSLCALDDCELLAFPSSEFFDLARGEAVLVGEILDRALHALARSREKSITLGRKTAQERVASFLVTMAHRIGSAQDDGCVLDLPMSRRDVADSLGLTIETISRQLGELRTASLIETSGRSIVRLLDIAALDALAGHLPAAA